MSTEPKPSTIENLKNDDLFLDKLTIQDFNKDTICTVQSIIKANIKHNLKKLAREHKKQVIDLAKKSSETPIDESFLLEMIYL